MLKWLKAFADERSLAWQQDAVGNLVIKRTGSGGGERAPAVVIQARQPLLACYAGAVTNCMLMYSMDAHASSDTQCAALVVVFLT